MLSVLIFLPLPEALLAALLAGAQASGGGRAAGYVSLLFATVTLGLAIGDRGRLRHRQGGLQQVTDVTWISQLGIHYKLGVDGLNLFLIALTALLWVGATACVALPRVAEGPRLYYLMLALGETAALGAFCAQDLALFVLFFDLMLVPFYFLIGIWGR